MKSNCRLPRARARTRTLALVLALLWSTTAAAADLKPGDRAPSFSLPGSDGGQWVLEEVLKEKGGVVLAWFPKAFTPG